MVLMRCDAVVSLDPVLPGRAILGPENLVPENSGPVNLGFR